MIAFYLLQKKLGPTDRQILQDILPLLATISKLHSLEPIQKLAEDLAIAIATHGAVSSASIHQAGQDRRTTGKRNERLNVDVGDSTTKGITKGELGRPKAQSCIESDVAMGRGAQSGKEVNSMKRDVSATSDDVSKSRLHGSSTEDEFISRGQSVALPNQDIPEDSSDQNQDPESLKNDPLRTCGNVSNSLETSRQVDDIGTTDEVRGQSEHSTSQYKDGSDLERSKHKTTSDSETVEEIPGLSRSDSQIQTNHIEDSVLQQGRSDEDKGRQQEKPASEAFEEAMKDLTDPLLPVRGHGLIMLARLLKEKDPRALAESETLLKIFEEHLSDDDTYIYLPCINGLVALAGIHPDRVMPHLCSAFISGYATDQSKQWSATSRTVSLEKTLKMGEALVRATRQLGK